MYSHPILSCCCLPTAKWEDNRPSCCSHATAHNAVRILAPFSLCWSFFLFLLSVWLGLSIKRCTKAAFLTDPLNKLPALSYVRLPTFLQRTCSEIKLFFRVSTWIIENKLLFFIYLLVLCWVKLPPAVYPKAKHMLQPPLSKTDFLVFVLIYMECNRNFIVILHFVFSSLNGFARWNTQPEEFGLDFYFQLFFGEKPPPSLHVNMIPCLKSSTGGDVGLKNGTFGCCGGFKSFHGSW